MTLDPHGGAAVSTRRSLVQGTWSRAEGDVVIVTLRGPRPERMVFQLAGDELIARDWDWTIWWGQAGPGTLRRKQP